MDIQFLYFEDCPSYDIALERLQQVLQEESIPIDNIQIIKVETEKQARKLHFPGSPTIFIEGEDIVPTIIEDAETGYQLTCRVYQLEDGRFSPLPSLQMIRDAVQKHNVKE